MQTCFCRLRCLTYCLVVGLHCPSPRACVQQVMKALWDALQGNALGGTACCQLKSLTIIEIISLIFGISWSLSLFFASDGHPGMPQEQVSQEVRGFHLNAFEASTLQGLVICALVCAASHDGFLGQHARDGSRRDHPLPAQILTHAERTPRHGTACKTPTGFPIAA